MEDKHSRISFGFSFAPGRDAATQRMDDLFVDMIKRERRGKARVLGEVLIVRDGGFKEQLLEAMEVGPCARHQVPYPVVT